MKSNYIILGLLLGFVFIVFACDKDDTPEPEEEGVDCSPFTWYKDNDQDGFGDPDNTVSSCEQPVGFILNGTDCDDNNAAVNPNQEEIINDGIDNNCDGESVDAIPSAFEMTVESVGFNSALITWTESTTEIEADVFYRVYVNETEVASDLSRPYYLITDLDEGMSYDIKVSAYTEFFDFEVSPETIITPTASSGSVKLANVVIDFPESEIFHLLNYEYDDSGKLTRQVFIDPTNNGNFEINYSYDSSDRPLEINLLTYFDRAEFGDDLIDRRYLKYSWSSTTNLERAVDFGGQFVFSSENFSTYMGHNAETVTPNSFYIYEYSGSSEPPFPTYEGEMIRDSSNRLISIEAYFPAGDDWLQNFEYTGNNLTQVTNLVSGDFYTITYDSNPNYHQSIPNTLDHQFIAPLTTAYNRMGFLVIPYELLFELDRSSLMFRHENTNNPTSYSKNGTVLRTMDYDYYPSGYPRRVIIDGDPSKAIYFYYTAL